ncbi:MAG: hypothetical protein GF320_10450 [Armatimonadia bacterium]|nr:hypothetical protein [Armatimonadia bacterium]
MAGSVGLLLSSLVLAAPLMAAEPAELLARISVPETVLGPIDGADGPLAMGDVRVGDFDGDGTPEIVICRSVVGLKPVFWAALDLSGRLLWTRGDSQRTVDALDGDGVYRTTVPQRPGSFVCYDIDGDGASEVITLGLREDATATSQWHMDSVELLVLDGRTGETVRRGAPPELLQANALIDDQPMPPNWVHQRILIANLRGTERPRDLVVKLGDTIFALTDQLELLWTYRSAHNAYPRHNAYIPAVGDLTGDGRDEVILGHAVLQPDGTPLWEEFLGDNMDSVMAAPFRGGHRAILSGGGRVASASGRLLLSLGMEAVPHGQEIRCGDFDPSSPGPELAIRYAGHTPDIMLVAESGEILRRFQVQGSPNNTGMERIRWYGHDGPDLLYSPAALYDGEGSVAATFAGLPEPTGGNQGWHHCFPLPGPDGDAVLLYDPQATEVFIYSRSAAPVVYTESPRTYNARLMD